VKGTKSERPWPQGSGAARASSPLSECNPSETYPEGKENGPFFECFFHVCPEPVLVKCSFLYLNRAKSGAFLLTSSMSASGYLQTEKKTHKIFLVFNIKWFRMFVPSLSCQMSSFRFVSFRFVSFRFNFPTIQTQNPRGNRKVPTCKRVQQLPSSGGAPPPVSLGQPERVQIRQRCRNVRNARKGRFPHLAACKRR
jgi:hypothetical protein